MTVTKQVLRRVLPYAVIRNGRRIFYAGKARRCPVCDSSVRKFQPNGRGYPILEELEVVGGMWKEDDRCPICHASERVRLAYLYIHKETGLLTEPLRLLHFAPEKGLAERFVNAKNLKYYPADLSGEWYEHLRRFQLLNIHRMPFEEGKMDFIICMHVLEHVRDDREAMKEIFRVLKPGGKGILQVPISLSLDQTREEPSATSVEERIRLFGQEDHVRLYALDYRERLEEAGFSVKAWNALRHYPELADEYDLDRRERLYVCSRPE